MSVYFNVFLNSFEHDSIGRNRNDNLEENGNNYPDYFSSCVKKESKTPPRNIKNNNNIILNNNDTDGSSSILQLKTEPVGNPDSPESSIIDNPQPTSFADDCAGCGRLIQVKNDLNLKPIYKLGTLSSAPACVAALSQTI